MGSVLFSIKPQYTDLILSGKKFFEFRKNKCKSSISRMIIYASAPVSAIVGEVRVDSVIEDTPYNLRLLTKHGSGLSDEEFDAYFLGKISAVAYELSNPIRYNKSIQLHQIGMARPPQSYCYLNDYQYARIVKLLETVPNFA